MATRGVKKPKVKAVKKPKPKKVVKPKRVRPPIKAGSKAKKHDLRNAKGQFTKKRHDDRDILGRFAKKGKKPPVRYRRPVPQGMVKIKPMLAKERLKSGYIMEFRYGYKQKPGEVGGWKNDPRPVILLFYDDKIKYVEGINMNYLSEWYVKKVRQIMNRFPGVEGQILYGVFRKTARYAIKKGYRKYIRSSLRDVYLYVYEDEITRTLDELAKSKQSKLPAADSKKNREV